MQIRQIPMEQLVPLLEEQLRHGSARLPVTGSSMRPMLHGGRDIVSLARLTGHPRRGEVYLYRRENGQYVLHRLIRRDGDVCIFCGDNQWEKEYLSYEGIIARVDKFRRGGKWIDAEESRGYRLYTFVWTALFPLRPMMIATRRLLGRLRKLFRRDTR